MPVINSVSGRRTGFESYSRHRIVLLAVALLACGASSAETPYTKWSRYDAARRVVGTIASDPDGSGSLHYAATRNTYDGRGVVTRAEYGELATWQAETISPSNWTGFTIFRQTDYTYDSYGRKLSKQTSSGGIAYTLTQYSYDSVGRPDCTAKRMNVAAFAVDLGLGACQLGTEGAVGPDRIEKRTYDSSDRPLTITKAYGTSIQQAYATFTYTGAHQASARDANANVSTYFVDGLARLEYMYFPSKTTPGQTSPTDFERYGYDENGNRTLLKKRDNSQISYVYDALNRLVLKDLPGAAADTSFGYDLRSLQTSSLFSVSGDGTSNEYDGFGRLGKSTTVANGSSRILVFGYDANGNRTRVTYPDGAFFDYAYDGLDRMSRICENEANCETSATPVISVVYDSQGRRAQLTRGASVTSTGYGYDPVSRLSSVSQDLDGSNSGSDVTQSFSFNPVGQPLTRIFTNTAYAYLPPASSRSYSVNGLNQYTQINSPTAASLAYDANGNLTSDGVTTFSYDVENRLTGASGAQNASLSYDPNGRLSQVGGSNSTQLLYDGDRLIGEYNASGTLLRRYVHGAGSDEPLLWYEGTSVGLNNRRYFHANHQGTIMAIASSSGATLEKDIYDPYGVPGSLNTSRFQFTGQAYVPELGLYYYKARFYNASLGRFMQVDPIGYQDDFNLYAYTANDPFSRRDPAGTNSCGSMSEADCATFMAAQHATATQLYNAMNAIKGVVSALQAGAKLNSYQQGVADQVSKVVGKGAGTDLKTLNTILGQGDKMMERLNDRTTPANDSGTNGKTYAENQPGQLKLYRPFFNSSPSMMMQIIAHEANHYAGGQDRAVQNGKEYIDAYGEPEMIRQAQLMPTSWMLQRPDAITFALGFHRDDD